GGRLPPAVPPGGPARAYRGRPRRRGRREALRRPDADAQAHHPKPGGGALATDGTFELFAAEVASRAGAARDPQLGDAARAATTAVRRAGEWLAGSLGDPAEVEAGARRFALTLGRAL